MQANGRQSFMRTFLSIFVETRMTGMPPLVEIVDHLTAQLLFLRMRRGFPRDLRGIVRSGINENRDI